MKRSSAGWKGQVTLLQDEILFKMLPQMNVRLPGIGPEFISDLQAPFWVAQIARDLPAVQETWVQSLDQKDPLEKEMAMHSNNLAWRIPWTEEPGGLQTIRSQRVGNN